MERRTSNGAIPACIIVTLCVAFSSPAPARAAIERLEPAYNTIRTRQDPRTEVLIYTPTIPPIDGAAVIYFSSNWGWRPIMQDTASHFAAMGRYVLGIDSRRYFEKILTPENWEKDLRTLRAHVNGKAGRAADAPVILAGFGFGANIIPYVLNRAGANGIGGALLISAGEEGATICRMQVQLDIPVPEEERFDVADEIATLPPIPIVLIGSVHEAWTTTSAANSCATSSI